MIIKFFTILFTYYIYYILEYIYSLTFIFNSFFIHNLVSNFIPENKKYILLKNYSNVNVYYSVKGWSVSNINN